MINPLFPYSVKQFIFIKQQSTNKHGVYTYMSGNFSSVEQFYDVSLSYNGSFDVSGIFSKLESLKIIEIKEHKETDPPLTGTIYQQNSGTYTYTIDEEKYNNLLRVYNVREETYTNTEDELKYDDNKVIKEVFSNIAELETGTYNENIFRDESKGCLHYLTSVGLREEKQHDYGVSKEGIYLMQCHLYYDNIHNHLIDIQKKILQYVASKGGEYQAQGIASTLLELANYFQDSEHARKSFSSMFDDQFSLKNITYNLSKKEIHFGDLGPFSFDELKYPESFNQKYDLYDFKGKAEFSKPTIFFYLLGVILRYTVMGYGSTIDLKNPKTQKAIYEIGKQLKGKLGYKGGKKKSHQEFCIYITNSLVSGRLPLKLFKLHNIDLNITYDKEKKIIKIFENNK